MLAFCLRTEMMELLLPLICVAGVYRWVLEDGIFTKENYRKYFTVFGAVLAGMCISVVVDRAAFGTGDWKAYVDFFNSRTELYDFQGIPPYEGNEGLYEALGMSESGQHMLLEEYNFGLDDSLDGEVLDRVIAHQKKNKQEKQQLGGRIKELLWVYTSRMWPPKAKQLSGIVHWPEGRLSVVFIRGKNCFVDVYYVEGQRTGAHHPFSVSNGTVYSSGHAVYGVYGGANGKPGHSKKGQYKAKGR